MLINVTIPVFDEEERLPRSLPRLHRFLHDHSTRGWKREIISRCYNRIIRTICGTRFADAQCGFKAITRETAMRLLPQVEDNGWFFDTELLILAEKLGRRLCELPVRWQSSPHLADRSRGLEGRGIHADQVVGCDRGDCDPGGAVDAGAGGGETEGTINPRNAVFVDGRAATEGL